VLQIRRNRDCLEQALINNLRLRSNYWPSSVILGFSASESSVSRSPFCDKTCIFERTGATAPFNTYAAMQPCLCQVPSCLMKQAHPWQSFTIVRTTELRFLCYLAIAPKRRLILTKWVGSRAAGTLANVFGTICIIWKVPHSFIGINCPSRDFLFRYLRKL